MFGKILVMGPPNLTPNILLQFLRCQLPETQRTEPGVPWSGRTFSWATDPSGCQGWPCSWAAAIGIIPHPDYCSLHPALEDWCCRQLLFTPRILQNKGKKIEKREQPWVQLQFYNSQLSPPTPYSDFPAWVSPGLHAQPSSVRGVLPIVFSGP